LLDGSGRPSSPHWSNIGYLLHLLDGRDLLYSYQWRRGHIWLGR
jgi:hypothetical protein